MKLSKDKAEAFRQIIDQLRANVAEAANIALRANTYVVCFAEDDLPFRTNGKQVSPFGGPIWTSTDIEAAKRLAFDLQQVANRNATEHGLEKGKLIIVRPACLWGDDRAAALEAMAKQWTEQAASQGVTL